MTDCNPTILKAELKSLSVINERLNCEIGNLKIELDSMSQENSRLREALEFYADAENYHAICFLFDPPCGGFAEDFDTNFDCYGMGGGQYDRPMPGKAAREALNPTKS